MIQTQACLGISRDCLKRGVLHIDITSRPTPTAAGCQSPFSGHHFSHHAGSSLLQFPPEILKHILAYLEPIWLFQVAAAYTRINDLLDFETSNRIWYDAVPAALFLEPESFQDEALVKDRILACSKGVVDNKALQFS